MGGGTGQQLLVRGGPPSPQSHMLVKTLLSLVLRACMVALYQITVVYGGRHLVTVFPGAPGYVVSSIWLHLISLVTVD